MKREGEGGEIRWTGERAARRVSSAEYRLVEL